MYGLAGGMALTLYASAGVANMVNGLYTSLDIPDTMISIVNIITPEDFSLIAYLIYGVLVIYSIVSGYLIKLMDGGHYQVSLMHFVIMLWVASIVGYIAEVMTGSLLGTSLPI
jgi:flagellar protein FlaJ